MKHSILCVDDEQHNLDALFRTLRKEYHVIMALNGKDGLQLLKEHDISLIISDQRMPEMTGVEFLEKTLDIKPDIQRIILTGYTEVDDLISAINTARVFRYITKPWEPNDLKMTIKNALENMELSIENRRLLEDTIRLEKLATVGQVATGIAHEVKNQLSVLMGMELIQQQFPDHHLIREIGDNILHAKDRIVTILDEIKSFSKNVETQLRMTQVSVETLINTTLHIVEHDPEVKGTSIKVSMSEPVKILCDKDRIVQVLINLIRNAAQAMNNTGVIFITCINLDETVSITIKDTGMGISENLMDTIWVPFYTTKKEKGTGLGLSICNKIVEMHHGTIQVESQVGMGSTFSLILPFYDEKQI